MSLMLCSSCDPYLRNTKQERRSCTMILWIWKKAYVSPDYNDFNSAHMGDVICIPLLRYYTCGNSVQ